VIIIPAMLQTHVPSVISAIYNHRKWDSH